MIQYEPATVENGGEGESFHRLLNTVYKGSIVRVKVEQTTVDLDNDGAVDFINFKLWGSFVDENNNVLANENGAQVVYDPEKPLQVPYTHCYGVHSIAVSAIVNQQTTKAQELARLRHECISTVANLRQHLD